MAKIVRTLLACVGGLSLVYGCSTRGVSEESAPVRLNKAVPVLGRESFPRVELRGYGVVAGQAQAVTAPGGPAALLQVHCADEAAAKLLCAKYLSDVMVLPRVKAITVALPGGGGSVAAQEAQGQGCVAAGRVGKDVTIVAAGSGADLAWVIGQTSGLEKAVWESETTVPMWLDRWDKYSFRHYYWPWQMPKGQTEATYDFVHEFDYAKEQDQAGFLLHIHPLATDSADGMLNTGHGGWVADEARKRNLTV
ncbi:MAG: hypothetical protein WCI73_17505, partial [Phycisphaerae bacterium]